MTKVTCEKSFFPSSARRFNILSMPRSTSLFQFKRGDHVCVFYEDQAALLNVLTPYVADGLRHGERCFCVQKEEVLQQLSYELRFLGVDIEREQRRGALEFHTEREVYVANGSFDAVTMMNLLKRSIAESAERGFKAFRSAGELAWAAKGLHNCDHLLGYERMVDEYYPNQPAIGMCQYPIREFPSEVLQAVLDVHRQSLTTGSNGSTHSSLNICRGRCCGHIIANRTIENPSYYYVVEDKSRNDFRGWGWEPTLEDATLRVEELFERPVAMQQAATVH
jgi:hypothetical protein